MKLLESVENGLVFSTNTRNTGKKKIGETYCQKKELKTGLS